MKEKEWIVRVPCTVTVYVNATAADAAIEQACEEIEQSGASPDLTEITDEYDTIEVCLG
jgi:hypothetical protein